MWGVDRSADDSQYIHNTSPSSYSNNNTLNDTSYSNTSDMFRPSSMRKRPRRYSSESDTSYGYTSNESNDDRKHKKKSLNIHYARIRVIRKLKGSDVNIFNPALHEHSASSEAPAIKSVQTLRNCISLMMQLVVKYHKNDAEALEGAVKYLGQFDSICTEYNNDACVADLLDLDMHCRHKSGRWRYSDNDKIVRSIMRKLQNKMISNMPIERERTSTYNNYNNITIIKKRRHDINDMVYHMVNHTHRHHVLGYQHIISIMVEIRTMHGRLHHIVIRVMIHVRLVMYAVNVSVDIHVTVRMGANMQSMI